MTTSSLLNLQAMNAPLSSGAPDDKRRLRKTHLTVLGVFVMLALVLNWPLPMHLGKTYMTPVGDFAHGYWNYWWAADALDRGVDPMHTDKLWPPDGASLVWGNFPVLLVYAAAPLTWAFGPAVAYNVMYLLSFVLAGWGAYLLARYLTGSVLSGLGAGLVYGFMPWNFFYYANPAYSHTEWLPFTLLFLFKLRDTGHLRHAVFAGIFLGCATLTTVYYGIYDGLAVLLFGLFVATGDSGTQAGRKRILGGVLICAGVTALVALYRLVPMIAAIADGTVESEVAARTQADLLGLGVRLDPDELDSPKLLVGWPALYGYVAIVGAVLALFMESFRRTSIWVVLGVFFFLVSLGTEFQIGGKEGPGIPMPADLLTLIPLLDSLRGFEKAQHVTVLAIAILFAWTLSALAIGREGDRKHGDGELRRGLLTGAVLLAVCLGEYWPPPRKVREDPVPEFYYSLAASTDERSVLVVPFDPLISDRSMMRPMFLQTIHGKPLYTGHYASRYNRAYRERLGKSPFLGPMLAKSNVRPRQEIPVPAAEQAAALVREAQDLGIGTVFLQPQLVLWEGEFSLQRGPVGLDKSLASCLLPIWWGPRAVELQFPPVRDEYEYFAPPRQVWMHPSIVEYLKAILGEPTEIQDGGLVFEVPMPEGGVKPPDDEAGSEPDPDAPAPDGAGG